MKFKGAVGCPDELVDWDMRMAPSALWILAFATDWVSASWYGVIVEALVTGGNEIE